VWVPLGQKNDSDDGWYLSGIGRLKPGVSTKQAEADLMRVHKSLIASGWKVNEITSPILTPIRERYLGDFRTTSQVLLVAVAVVLLIACVNIAALMLVRSSSRAHEVAVRAAIGASRGRIIRQLLTETGLLALVGGIAGVLLGRLGLRAIVSLLPDTMPRWIDFQLDIRFAAFCILATAASAVLFGLFPALQASRTEIGNALQVSARRA
jgi:putative ABC transport system permease protein